MARLLNIPLLLRPNLQPIQKYSFRLQSNALNFSRTTERVVITNDGSTIVCWHPERPFPYECSKPIPEEVSEDTNSVLKVQNLSKVYDVFKTKNEEQTREELMKLTYTTKHIWFPRGKRYYRKKPIPRDREYL